MCLPHAGGALPYLYGRLTHGQGVRPETRGVARKPFTAYLRRFTYDTISHSPEILGSLIATVGADRVMLGSDYCFDMGVMEPLETVERLTQLTEAERDQIIGTTACRLLKL